jgi:hypothetical protein
MPARRWRLFRWLDVLDALVLLLWDGFSVGAILQTVKACGLCHLVSPGRILSVMEWSREVC